MSRHVEWEQLVALAEGTLPAAQRAAAQAHLARCAPCAAEARWLRLTLGALRDGAFVAAPPAAAREAALHAFEQRHAAPLARPAPRRSVPRRSSARRPAAPLGWGLVGVAALLLLAFFFVRRSPVPPLVASLAGVEGAVQLAAPGSTPSAATGGQPLVAGAVVSTGADGRAVLSVAGDGLRVALLAEGEMTLEQQREASEQGPWLRLRLGRGEVVATVRAGNRLTLLTPAVTLESTGGLFAARLLPDGTLSLSVEQGALVARNAQGQARVEGGQRLLIYPNVAPGRLPTSTPPFAATPSALPPTPASGLPTEPAAGTLYGLVVARPAGTVGEWRIGSASFVSDGTTRLEEDGGPLDVGRCVRVDYQGARAQRIRGEPPERCGGPPPPTAAPDDDERGADNVGSDEEEEESEP